uniref:NADH-ubiquinone oxidoreductase chain 3 n=1 Tax=Dorymyrmex brunneus TaxID=609524 RepID=A0A343YVE1_9HYME|nr:NADH dehydrogenase subunit 3 [Dorymyrmex brunneus]
MFLMLLFSAISIFLILINLLISKKKKINREKSSPFECGFDPISNGHIPFSIHFFMISLIFLIFDIEITILIPLVTLLYYMNLPMILTSMFFMIILITGLYIEYLEESIEWKLS